ncbi:MAG: AAA family ATPase [Nitrobacter sp.]|uniref:AAA family ATPase n=1 Tax=Nitrobacter sp. TaxID=29420 RepID=UPI002604D161|nr:AAA family ATPase [Nitrobacter sp.]MCV0386858.1 AAA family ATPase [Nitrobacter sp.]
MTCRISKLEIQGFRAFGRAVQTLDLPSLLAAVCGPNSQGKTSLAEAVEFLLTGQIVRRALMASSQDEFADALRNAHLPAGAQVFVQATIRDSAGAARVLKRVLKTDYSKKQECETVFTIDEQPANEAALAALGVVLSQPPFRAPVLAQHTLGYVFSARPQDRASYFKALLEVTDIEEFRNQVAALGNEIAAPASPLIEKLKAAAGIAGAGRLVKPLLAKVLTPAEMAVALAACAKELVAAAGETPPVESTALFARLGAFLTETRAKIFALKGFDRKPLAPWSGATVAQQNALTDYVAERGKVDEETRRLVGLFREALAVPAVEHAHADIDCPLCGSEAALTTARIAHITGRLADTESLQQAQKDAAEALTQMQALIKSAVDGVVEALPLLITHRSRARRARGIRVARIHTLLGAKGKPQVELWLFCLRRLVRARTRLVFAAKRFVTLIEGAIEKPESLDDALIRDGFVALATARDTFAAELVTYDPAEKAVSDGLRDVVDAQSETTGWQELIDLAGDQVNLRAVLVDRSAHEQAVKEIAQALKQIDKGNEAVLEEKFGDLSDGVQTWWDLLRPDELSFFSGVRPRPGARRTIDFKAGLSANADRSEPKLRDVIAVFSQSQLHCLGLALFLARAVKENSGFIVLDDPILSSDEDYRAYFTSRVIEKLLALGMQVIVLTQDQRTWRDLGECYLHQNITQFQIALINPADGSTVINTADDIGMAFDRAEKLIRGAHPELLKQAGGVIRNAAERFCKEMLVKDRRRKSDTTAALSDYTNRNLGQLCPLVEPLLTRDASHPGKLRTIGSAVNPANHDDAVPAAGELKVALGNLRSFKKEYL